MSPRRTASEGSQQTFKAIGLMVLATMCFALLDTTVKYLVDTEDVPTSQATWLRFAGHVVFSAVFLWPFALRPSLHSVRPLIQVLRSCLMILTTALNFIALKYLQLDQTVTIFFLTPLLVAALAGPLLGEWVGWHRMVAIAAGFVGILVVMHPGFEEMHWAMLLMLGATTGYALYNVATRYLAAHDPAAVTQTYTPLVGVLVMTPFALMDWQSPDSWLPWVLFATLGFWGGLGHWLLILAHRLAPAGVLAPYIYLGLIWMSVGGFLVFGDVPTGWTLSGGAIVILAGLYLLARERQATDRGGPAAEVGPQ
jgi:drug/metabolite transporter (DMT)-like permease